jgi:hypothetical protein
MKLLFEGALQTQTKANSLSNPYVTNLTAAQDKLLGGVYHVGQLYSMEVCDWTAGQAAGKTRANTANQEKRPPDPGLGEGGGGGSCLGRDEGGSHFEPSQPSATEEDES